MEIGWPHELIIHACLYFDFTLYARRCWRRTSTLQVALAPSIDAGQFAYFIILTACRAAKLTRLLVISSERKIYYRHRHGITVGRREILFRQFLTTTIRSASARKKRSQHRRVSASKHHYCDDATLKRIASSQVDMMGCRNASPPNGQRARGISFHEIFDAMPCHASAGMAAPRWPAHIIILIDMLLHFRAVSICFAIHYMAICNDIFLASPPCQYHYSL